MKFDLNIDNKKTARNKRASKVSRFKNEQDLFKRKRIKAVCIILSFILIYYLASIIAEFKNFSAVFKLPLGIIWLVKNFIPNAGCIKYFSLILKTAASTTCAAVIAFCFAVLGSNSCGLNGGIRFIISLIASCARNVPLIAWAILLLFSFKQNNFTGFLALFIITFGHLLRAFKEMIDETAADSFKALRAAGAPYLSAVFQSIIPNTAPGFLSWLLYALESNVRDLALIGILTGTGAGFLFNLYFKSFRYNEAGTVVLVLVITVLVIDIISNKIRQSLI